MLKRTKIVATLGPATSSEEALSEVVSAGVDVVRLNFSHGSSEEHRKKAALVRQISKVQARHIAILGDLQGPKIRISCFKNKSVQLKKGQSFTLNAQLDHQSGTENEVGITYHQLIKDCPIGGILLLDDGRVTMEIMEKDANRLQCKVLQDGSLSNNKGINLQGGGISANALTDKDKDDIKLAAALDVDYLAVSFVHSPNELHECRTLFQKAGGKGNILAKIECAEAVANQESLESIIKAADAVMVARGDLGVEIGDAELVAVQKNIITTSKKLNKPVITATQMMESMINNTQPTRAEVFDVANAVLDGTDAVMLSAETATGKFPQNVVAAMHRIVLGAEKHIGISSNIDQPTLNTHFSFLSSDETIAVSAVYAANNMHNIKGIACLTKSGQTALWMSRINSTLPIFAFSRYASTCRRMALFRGVYPFYWECDPHTHTITEKKESYISSQLMNIGYKKGDKIILTFGGHYQSTNTLKIVVL